MSDESVSPEKPAIEETSTYITIDDLAKVEIKVGTILEAEEIEDSEKLLKLKVDFGQDSPRQILSGIKKWYSPADLIDKQCLFVTNLKPRQMMGMESQGMILAVDGEDGAVLLSPIKPVAAGVSTH